MITGSVLATLAALQIKHWLIDWFWQTKYELHNKGTYGHWGGIQHAAKNGGGTGLCFLIMVDPATAALIALLDAAIHYHIDWTKSQLNSMLTLTPSHKDFWTLIGLDQMAHQLCYVAWTALAVTVI